MFSTISIFTNMLWNIGSSSWNQQTTIVQQQTQQAQQTTIVQQV